MDAILNLIVSNVDYILVLLSSTLASGKPAEKHVQTIAWVILRYEAELRAAVSRTTNTLDDALVDELIQAAGQLKPAA